MLDPSTEAVGAFAGHGTIPDAPASRFLHDYAASREVFDELRGADGAPRLHWRKFLEQVESLGPVEFQRRWEQAQRLIHDHGVTYNVYGDSATKPRPWELDGLPLVVDALEWRGVADGIAQRARLLNRITADLYGEQMLVRRGLLPPELVFEHPGFLRPCHNQLPPEGIWLHLYAADLARAPDGKWWVVADRTDAPSGAGYALENRIVTSRTLANVIHECQVERLAPFFIAMRDTLQRIALRHRDNPRFALLSPGPRSPTYFEDAYLARYLGLTLVEGGDLAVRNNKVMLKALAGLLPVDVLMHRIDDADCDPLELRSNSLYGVAGMLQASRASNITIANTLGSGVVEAPAFCVFLPQLCRELLGEELRMPSAPTYWCGEPMARDYVLANLESLLIKPAFRRGRIEQMLGRPPGQVTLGEIRDAIKARPAYFVGQEQIARSAAPSWIGSLKSAHISLRTYAVATSGNGYSVMPGGLTRVSYSPYTPDATLATGEGSKDCWVLSEGPVPMISLLPAAGASVELRRSGAELPSRVADNLFWLGRNVERAEGAARLLRTVVARLTGESTSAVIPELPVLIRGLAEQGQIEPGFAIEGIRAPLPAIEKALPIAVFDLNEPRSLRCILSSMHRIASIVRDRISLDSWRIIHRIDQEFQPPKNRSIDLGEVLAMLNQVIMDLSAFSGLVADSMTRTQGWRFLEIGRRIERSLHTVSLVQNALVDVSEHELAILDAVLEVADSRMTYRSRYLGNLQAAPVLDLLLTDESNPRAVAYQLVALAEHVEHLPRDRSQPLRSPGERLALSCLHGIRMAEVDRLSKVDSSSRRRYLARLLMRLAVKLPRLSDAIGHKYLIHAGTPRQLAEFRPE